MKNQLEIHPEILSLSCLFFKTYETILKVLRFEKKLIDNFYLAVP